MGCLSSSLSIGFFSIVIAFSWPHGILVCIGWYQSMRIVILVSNNSSHPELDLLFRVVHVCYLLD